MSGGAAPVGGVDYRPLRTLAELEGAVANGDRVEFTSTPSDRIDMPPWDQFGSGGWIPVPGDASSDRVMMRQIERGERSHCKYRATGAAS